jgi:hypothetical protein
MRSIEVKLTLMEVTGVAFHAGEGTLSIRCANPDEAYEEIIAVLKAAHAGSAYAAAESLRCPRCGALRVLGQRHHCPVPGDGDTLA